MWQEIVVGLIVALAAALIVRRYWKTFAGRDDSRITCSCGCTHCDQGSGQEIECSDGRGDSGS